MGLIKKIRKKVKKTVKKAVKNPVKAVGNVAMGGKVGKKLLRKGYAATAGFNPMLGGAGLFLQPGQLGIKNKENAKLFDRSQRIGRIGTGAAAAIGGAMLAGPALSGAGTFGPTLGHAVNIPGAGMGGGSFFGGLGGAKSLLAGGAILAPMLQKPQNPNMSGSRSGPMDMSAGNFSWGGSGGNVTAGQGLNYNQGSSGFDMGGNYTPGGSPESLQLAYLQQMLRRGGLTPEARMSRENRAKQNIRGAQADRGMFNSGLAMRQEAEMMPEIQAQMDQQDFSNLGSMYGMLEPMVGRNFAGNQANLDRIYGLQRDRNQYLFGGARQEDAQDFLARMNYQNQQNQMWNNIGAAGANYFLS